MNTVFVRILSGNMGDGWADERDAANGFAKWLRDKKAVEVDVQHASGVGGGSYDDNGDEIADINEWWAEWCESEDAKKYFESGKNYDHLTQGYYGYVNQVIEHDNARLVETHLAEWDPDGGWECAEWTLIIDGEEKLIARCDGYSGVDFLEDISEYSELMAEWIEETVTPYELTSLQLEARDSEMEDAKEGDVDVRILETREYANSDVNAASNNRPKLITDDDYTEKTWPTYAEAKAWIEEQEGQTYYLDHGEMGRPSYRIVK